MPCRLGHGLLASSDLHMELIACQSVQCRLSSAAGIDLQATAQWCEKALPYLGILLIVFVRQHIVGAALLRSHVLLCMQLHCCC